MIRPLSAVGRALRAMRRSPLIQLLSIGTVALSFLLVGAVAVTARNVAQLVDAWGRSVQMTVFLREGTSREQVQKVSAEIQRAPAVERVRYVSPAEAYQRLRESLGRRGAVLDGVEEGFLPASIEVTLAESARDVLRVHPLIARLARTEGVEEVEFMGEWVEKLTTILRLIRLTGMALGAMVLLAGLYVVGSTIRLGVLARRQEIEILELVGATPRFVRAPFLIEGAIQGGVGAGLALAALHTIFQAASPHLESGLLFLLGEQRLVFLTPLQVGIGVAAGILLGVIGSRFAVRGHARL